MIVVTGGAGFIGSNIVKALNERGERDVFVVDNLEKGDKFLNLTDCEIGDYCDKREFIERLRRGDFKGKFSAVFHEGACSDTMEHNGVYMMQNNFEYSKTLLHYCQDARAPFIYASSASVYGGGRVFKEERGYEAPLNVYGYSKFLFDQYVRRLRNPSAQIVGFRYFNVYGDREQHKGRMASVAFHFFNQYRNERKVRLFAGSGGYADGEQRRDFVSVEDVVAVNLFFLDHPDKSGIFNVGTGRSQTFNDVAVATINALRQPQSAQPAGLKALQAEGAIQYIAFPAALVGKYQSFTEASVDALRAVGYTRAFFTVEEGVARYIGRLSSKVA